MGWELFKNYLIAKEKFKPDFFLYENNKSASQAIKDQIAEEFGVGVDPNVRFTYINSALVSAQNRQRFYVTNFGDIEQPEDRGILLKDILENSNGFDESDEMNPPCGQRNQEKARTLTSGYANKSQRDLRKDIETDGFMGAQGVVEPVNTTPDGKSQTIKAQYSFTSIQNICCYESTYGASGVAKPTDESASEQFMGKGKDKNAMKRVYEVKDGLITIKGKQYPIKLQDGCYIIRKLTPIECERLQTLPDGYTRSVSNAQRYKGLGNGWTAEVIIHILNGALKDVPRDEEIVVLSMYDGIGTGRYCLDKMGFTNVRYYAYEIDKYAKQVAMSNYPDIIQCGDAFDLRHPDWTIGY